jgi:hypothetical protein
MVLTLHVCVLYGSHNKQRLLPYRTLADWFCITVVESVYSAVRTESLCTTDTFSLQKVTPDTLHEHLRASEVSLNTHRIKKCLKRKA